MADTAHSPATPIAAGLLPADRARQEAVRLLLQGAIYDPITFRFLRDAGLQEGMRVLDIGSGAGSVSLLISGLVGPDGEVVGMDCSPEMIDLATQRIRIKGRTNISFVQGDVSSVQPDGSFDAIVGRFILRELSSREHALERLWSLIRPSGLIALQEKVLAIPVTSMPPLPSVEQTRMWLDQARSRAGVEVQMGAKLASLFASAGLPAPVIRMETPVGYGADWCGFDYLAETLRAAMPVIQLYGIASEREIGIETLADRMRAEAARLNAVVMLTPCIGAFATQSHQNP
jgi:predicted O-methyltransferase YrrM